MASMRANAASDVVTEQGLRLLEQLTSNDDTKASEQEGGPALPRRMRGSVELMRARV